jgi:class 3 adenylate cyclase
MQQDTQQCVAARCIYALVVCALAGCTLIALFGLAPVAHSNDAIRAVLASLRLCERLFDLGAMASVGVTTGETFCGVVGSKTRREYTVLSDSTNLAARLMQRAAADRGESLL